MMRTACRRNVPAGRLALALVASLLAWAEGVTLEIGEQFDSVYANAQSQWGQYLHFSGGSRFDKEFLIRVTSLVNPSITGSINSYTVYSLGTSIY